MLGSEDGAGKAEGEMGLLGRAADAIAPPMKAAAAMRGGAGRLQIAEQRLGEEQTWPRSTLPARRDHEPFGPILLVQPGCAVGDGQRGCLASCPAPGGRAVGRRTPLRTAVEDQVVGRIEAFAKLRQDDQLLALQLGLVECGARIRSAISSSARPTSGPASGRGTRSGRERSRR